MLNNKSQMNELFNNDDYDDDDDDDNRKSKRYQKRNNNLSKTPTIIEMDPQGRLSYASKITANHEL